MATTNDVDASESALIEDILAHASGQMDLDAVAKKKAKGISAPGATTAMADDAEKIRDKVREKESDLLFFSKRIAKLPAVTNDNPSIVALAPQLQAPSPLHDAHSIQPLPVTTGSPSPVPVSIPGAIAVAGFGGPSSDLTPAELEEMGLAPPRRQPDSPEVHNNSTTALEDGLVQARAVGEESEHAVHGEAQEVDPHEMTRKKGIRKQQKRRMHGWLAVAAVVVVSGTTLALVMGLNKKESATDAQLPTLSPSGAPSGVPSAAPTSLMDAFVETLPNNTIVNIMIDSPQRNAYDWLSQHRNITTMPDWRKTQLMALATFYFAFGGPNWPEYVRNNWMDDEVHECYWFSTLHGHFDDETGEYVHENENLFFNDTQCNERGEYRSIALREMGLDDYNPYLPPEIGLLSSLTSINLDFNGINYIGPPNFIPEEIGQLTNLQFFRIWANNVAGSIPSEFGLLTKMTILDFDGNSLYGSMPTEFFQLSELKELWFNHNDVTGTIPTELGLMKSLELVEWTGNAISGSIPTQVGLLENLGSMAFGDNPSLTGKIPSEIGRLTNLEQIWITDTLVTGGIPSQFGLLSSNMKRLMLGRNYLTGTIPTAVGAVQKLRQLDLGRNYLSGPIPTELGLLKDMYHLDLSMNAFLTGTIPSELEGLVTSHNLSYVNITGNTRLEGIIPQELCTLSSHNGTCEYKFWFALAIHLNKMNPCSMEFDCTPELFGCNCTLS